MKFVKIIAVVAAALGFVSCGSGSSASVPAADTVPATSYEVPAK